MIENLFPHQSAQQDDIAALKARLETWKECIEYAVFFFTRFSQLEGIHAQKVANLLPKSNKSQSPLALYEPIQGFVEKIQSEMETSREKMQTKVIKPLLELQINANGALKRYNSKVASMKRPLELGRSSAAKAVRIHQKSVEKKVPEFKLDPWLLEKQCRSQLASLTTQENLFTARFKELCQEIRCKEQDMHAEWTRIYETFQSVQNSQWHELQHKMTTIAAQISQAATPVAPVDLDVPEWGSRKLSDFPYQLGQIKTLETATLARPGALLKKRWKPATFVLSETGFLHCLSPLDGRAFYSICLFRPVVQVSMPEAKAHLHVFQITVCPTSEKKSIKYCIKAGSQDQLIHWVSEIKKKIDSYIPTSPPVPLYSPASERRELLEKAITLTPRERQEILENISSQDSIQSPASLARSAESLAPDPRASGSTEQVIGHQESESRATLFPASMEQKAFVKGHHDMADETLECQQDEPFHSTKHETSAAAEAV
ncbi:MAG: hypothetical protein SGCHY_003230 [Lobulomycetales sp.]